MPKPLVNREIVKAGTPIALGAIRCVATGPAYNVVSTDQVLLIDDDAIGQKATVLLPAAVDNKNRRLTVKKIGTTAEVVIDGNGAETIDTLATQTISSQFESLSIVSNGVAWFIFATPSSTMVQGIQEVTAS